MSDPIKHECGVAIVRLKKPIAHYHQTYGSSLWGLKKLYLLMEKQRNRGQDGAGIGVLKLSAPFGSQYYSRHREAGANCLDKLWRHVNDDRARLARDQGLTSDDPVALMRQYPWLGEIMIGHLRYGTHGGNNIDSCHPFVRASNWRSRFLSVAGNFNLTNTDGIFDLLVGLGQHPIGSADTSTVMEKIGHFLDVANEALLRQLADRGERGSTATVTAVTPEGASRDGQALATRIADNLDLGRVLKKAAISWDGGYFMIGAVGHGACFAMRDPNGIRPGFYYEDEDVVAVASERAALVTCFNVKPEAIKEVTPGCALIINHRGEAREFEILPKGEKRSCTFERIYFSRGNDADIYRERKALGRELVPALLKTIDHDLSHAVVSFIPNTAEVAYHGLLEGLEEHLAEWKEREILRLQADGQLTQERLRELLAVRPWHEKAAHKDAKLRTFISGDSDRDDLVSHVYDITRGVLRPGVDSLVVIDDSIVRGTTLRQSILRMLSRLEPKQIVVLSSAPQIRYPDCYGIDMSELGRFVAFEAAVTLLRERGQAHVLDEVYKLCKSDPSGTVNHVKRVYAPFSDDEISAKVAELVTPKGLPWKGQVKVVFQSVQGLRWAIPNHTGDWYFTGDYPTPGGYRVVNRAFVNFMENRQGRAYEAKP
jgi:amidophosphoribosyltransferase